MKMVFVPFAFLFLCLPLNIMWLFLNIDMFGKIGYVVLMLAVVLDLFAQRRVSSTTT